MGAKAILDSLNLAKQCRKYGIPLWECPQFLFVILGLVVISSSVAIYLVGSSYSDSPEIVTSIVLTVAAVLMVIGFVVTQSFERLAEVARLKSEFIGIVSHQLRSPLANLRWVVDLMISGKTQAADEKNLSYLQILRENSSRMEELIRDLLVLSRLETGDLALRREKLALPELFEKVVQRFVPLAQASNIQITVSCPPDLSPVWSDASLLSLVVENLLDNAIRYIKSRGAVDLKAVSFGGFVRVEVRDTGLGIPRDDQKYIFQKFFRGENAVKHQTQGSGLGLYIAKMVVEKSGGQIGFNSKPGEGSTFWFTVPTK